MARHFLVFENYVLKNKDIIISANIASMGVKYLAAAGHKPNQTCAFQKNIPVTTQWTKIWEKSAI